MIGSTPDVDVAIVGSGPYGLSIAAHLAAVGVDHRIFGRPMRAWQSQMPAGMHLKSEGFASNLSDRDGRFTLAAHCTNTGLEYVGHFAHMPEFLAKLGPQFASHSSAHADLSTLKGQDVTVIGAGQSALESAALLHENGADVRVVIRGLSVAWNPDPEPLPRPLARRLRRPMSGLGPGLRPWFYSTRPDVFYHLPLATRVHAVRTVLGPAGAWWLRERVLGRIPLLLGHTVRAAEAKDGRVRLQIANGHERIDLSSDHVVAGTGYRVDLRRLAFLEAELRSGIRHVAHSPVLSPSFESSVPGLYFVGLAAAHHFGPVMRFVYGAGFTARRLTAALTRTSSRAELTEATGLAA
jgi:thioredoxin reductase